MIKIILFMTLFCTSLPAFGYGGVVKGTFKSFNNLGQYCPSDGSRSCTGSKYNQIDSKRYQPLRDMWVQVFVNGYFAGMGTTNISGQYEIRWATPPNQPYPQTILLRGTLAHKDGRFSVRDPDGSYHFMWGSTTPQVNTTVNNPQNLGTWYWGSANAPLSAYNAYEAACTWYYALRHSNKLMNDFHGLKINNGGNKGSYATELPFAVNIDDDRKFSFGTIAHEMGHSADVVAQPATSGGHQSCYPSRVEAPGTPCINIDEDTHHYLSEEWGHIQFLEGYATFVGSVAAFWSNAHAPIVCSGFGSEPCPAAGESINSHDLETRTEACTPQDSRRELNTSRYLRDLYDEGDTVDLYFTDMINGIQFLNHNGEGGKNEPWKPDFSGLDDFDGRSTKDFQHRIDSQNGITSYASNYIYNLNCNPVGDSLLGKKLSC